MRNQFPLFQSHLDLAHHYWKQVATLGDTVIDATCGNGHDTLVLAHIVLSEKQGHVTAYDIQESALQHTQHLLKDRLTTAQYQRITMIHGCHSLLPADQQVKLIVYNLGYLPKSDKSLTTRCETTLCSLEQALLAIVPGGGISVTCYPGHEEGKKEEDAILTWAAQLDPKQWSSCHHCWLNRKEAPSLLILQKAI